MEQTPVIHSGRQLSDEQNTILLILMGMIIPASDDGLMPAANELQIDRAIVNDDDVVLAAIVTDMEDLAVSAQQQFNCAFTELGVVLQQQLLDQLRSTNADFLKPLATAIAIYYYQHDRVLMALGQAPRSPSPIGNTVPAGDLSLLEPVRRRAPFYRS